jgi:CheY-like chemotaxis protein
MSSDPPPAPPRRKRIVLVDDNAAYCSVWKGFLLERYGEDRVTVETYLHPIEAMTQIDDSIDLLLVDLELPVIDGRKFVEFAASRGVDRKRIIVASGRKAEHLHDLFSPGQCLAVINKSEPRQQEAFLMILDGVVRKE